MSQGKAQPCSAQRWGEAEVSWQNLLQQGKEDSSEQLRMAAPSPLSPCSPARDMPHSSQIHHQPAKTKAVLADDTPKSPVVAPE